MKGKSSVLLAEFAILGALYFSKSIKNFLEAAEENIWLKQAPIEPLFDKKVLIVGLGGIGGEVAKKFHYGFSSNIYGVKNNIKKIPKDLQFVKKVIRKENLKELIPEMDIVVFSLPKN